jgi:hypothetical protein
VYLSADDEVVRQADCRNTPELAPPTRPIGFAESIPNPHRDASCNDLQVGDLTEDLDVHGFGILAGRAVADGHLTARTVLEKADVAPSA